MKSGVYLIHNIKQNKFYVGSAVDVTDRLRYHKNRLQSGKHSNRKLRADGKRDGLNAFRFYVILHCQKQDLIRLEQHFIEALEPQYNIAPNAGNCLGVKHTEEARQKMSEGQKKRYQDPEARRKTGEANKGKKRSEKTRRKMSEGQKKRYQDPEIRSKISKALKKRYQDPEIRSKISKALKKTYQDPEIRSKISEGMKKTYQNPEIRSKISEALKKAWQDPEIRSKHIEAQKGRKYSEETKRKISEAKKKYWAERKEQANV